MALHFVAGSSQYLEYGGAPATTLPLVMSAWFRIASATQHSIMGLYKQGLDEWRNLQADGSAVYADDKVAGVGESFAQSSAAPSTGVWHHALAVFASTTDRRVYLDGGSKGTNATSRAPTGFNRFAFGRTSDVSTNYSTGDTAFAALWSGWTPTDSDAVSLAAGDDPRTVRPEFLVAFWLLVGDRSPEIDVVGGFNLSLNNGPTRVDGPPTRWAYQQSDAPKSGAGGGGGGGTGGKVGSRRVRIGD